MSRSTAHHAPGGRLYHSEGAQGRATGSRSGGGCRMMAVQHPTRSTPAAFLGLIAAAVLLPGCGPSARTAATTEEPAPVAAPTVNDPGPVEKAATAEKRAPASATEAELKESRARLE